MSCLERPRGAGLNERPLLPRPSLAIDLFYDMSAGCYLAVSPVDARPFKGALLCLLNKFILGASFEPSSYEQSAEITREFSNYNMFGNVANQRVLTLCTICTRLSVMNFVSVYVSFVAYGKFPQILTDFSMYCWLGGKFHIRHLSKFRLKKITNREVSY